MDNKSGRPKQTDKAPRDKILRICLTEAEHNNIEIAAQKKFMNKSTWARSIILAEAEKILLDKKK